LLSLHYSIKIDGAEVPDPNSRYYFGSGRWGSAIEIPAKDRDFYAFYRSMQAYREAIGRDQDILVLKPDSDFFQFLQKQLGTTAK